MFEKLYRAIQDILPHKGFALAITVSTLGGATFLPYLADRMIDDYDELKYEYMIQRDRIKILQMENDSLQDRLRLQSIEFSKLLYTATADFNGKIFELEKRTHPALKRPEKIIVYQTDKPLPNLKRWVVGNYIIDSSVIQIPPAKEVEIKPSATPVPNKSDTNKTTEVKKKHHTPIKILDVFNRSKKTKPVFNPDRKK